jgi:citrate synthase
MTKEKPSATVSSRNEAFVAHTETRIWQEIPSKNNPYITESSNCHGYSLQELMKKRSYIDVVYLLFRGDLPTKEEHKLLEHLMIGLINPGPRHPATRAAMLAGVGKTEPSHILPIALTVLGGDHLGASEIEPAMRFLRKSRKHDPHEIACDLIKNIQPNNESDWHITAGFGNRYGGIDIQSTKLAEQLLTLEGKLETLQWAHDFSKKINDYNLGWLPTGLTAAVLTDLGFNPRAGAGLFQLFCAPGLLAHGVELANKPVTAMPFVKDDNYVIQYEK